MKSKVFTLVTLLLIAIWSAEAQQIVKYTLTGRVVDQKIIRIELNDLYKKEARVPLSLLKIELPGDSIYFSSKIHNKNFLKSQDLSKAEVIKKDFIIHEQATHSPENFEFMDANVKPSHVYAYWVVDKDNKVVAGPLALKVRDARIWYSQELIERKMDSMEQKYPQLAKGIAIGKTFQGRTIKGIIIGNPDNAILLVGNTHAGESGAEIAIYAAEKLLKEQSKLLKKVGVMIIPVLNIDSRNRHIEGEIDYVRKNANAVDLNRNLPAGWEVVGTIYGSLTTNQTSGTYRGPSPASEPENQALLNFLKNNKPKLGISYHHVAGITGDWLHYCKTTSEYEASVMAFGNEYIRGYRNDTGGQADKSDFTNEQSPGTFTKYFAETLNIPAFLTEAKWGHHTEIEKRANQDWATLQDHNFCREKHYQGILSVLIYLGR